MKYTPLDNLGLPTFKEDGTLSTITAPGNNYPANENGGVKSDYVTTREKNIVLKGKYPENEATYPLLNPIDADIKSIPNTDFRFLIKDIASKKLYASESLYNDLIKAYNEKNPWFTIYTVPTINLDIKYLAEYHKVNKFKISELYTEVQVTSTLDTEDEILQYIDWLVKPSTDTKNINIKPTSELGSWEYKKDGQLGLGYKTIYDSMIKDKNPDPEAIGDIPTNETYDLSIPGVTSVDTKFQPIPEEQIVPKLADALVSVRKPPGQPSYHPLGGGLAGWILSATAVAAGIVATFASGGTLLPVLVAYTGGITLTTAVVGGGVILAGLTAALQSIATKAKGSYMEYILARHVTRNLFESKSSVFDRERKGDEADWNALLSAARKNMGTTRITQTHLKQALQLAFAVFENANENNLTYKMKVGWWGDTEKTFNVNVKSASQLGVTLS